MELLRETPPPALAEYGIEFFTINLFGEGFTAKKHMHPAIEFIYVKTGEYEIESGGRKSLVGGGDTVLFRSNAVHVIKKVSAGDGLYYVLKMTPIFLFSMFQKVSIGNILPFLKSADGTEFFYPSQTLPIEIKKMWERLIDEYEANEPTFFAMQRFLACEFLLCCSRYLKIEDEVGISGETGLSEPKFRLIFDSVNYINENFASPLTAVGCARLVNLSYSYYAKLFHYATGKSFKDYLTELRMVKAYNMLLSSEMSVSDVAISCGYENFSHFIAEFKKKYKITPGQLRRNSKDEKGK